MTTLIDTIRDIAQKRITYSRIVAELESMPLNVALDLDIYKGDARKIAQKAVYGK